jgi:hypothetical protein
VSTASRRRAIDRDGGGYQTTEEVTMHTSHTSRWIEPATTASMRARIAVVGVMLMLAAAALAAVASAAPGAACGICGKNLIKNPGADGGAGITAVNAFGAVPGWTNEAGQFGAASYTFPNCWFAKRSKGPKDRGKNYFFGGTTAAAVGATATIGKQTIKLPAAAAGKKATLSGWLGNYGKNYAQVRAQFEDAAGTVVGAVKIGPDTTISGTDMQARSRSIKVPAGAKQVTIVVSFGGGGSNYKLAGADSLSLVLS